MSNRLCFFFFLFFFFLDDVFGSFSLRDLLSARKDESNGGFELGDPVGASDQMQLLYCPIRSNGSTWEVALRLLRVIDDDADTDEGQPPHYPSLSRQKIVNDHRFLSTFHGTVLQRVYQSVFLNRIGADENLPPTNLR